MKPKILIVDDEKPLRDTLAKWFKPKYDCLTAPDAGEALRLLHETPDLVLMISDVRMPGEDGVSLTAKAKAENPELAIILLTAYGTVDLAVEAMKHGADDFVQKPLTDLASFEAKVDKTVKPVLLARENEMLRAQLNQQLETFTGKSPAMEKVYALIRKLAPKTTSVLVSGPSGTGKELVAHALHNLSDRSKGPFVAVECAALPSSLLEAELFGSEKGAFTGSTERKIGRFEAANGGTLFLDEIGEIDAATQVKLLRVLQEHKFQRIGGHEDISTDFRLVAATNRDLAAEVANGKFREDLYYRLQVVEIKLPALKDRAGDVALLVAQFLREFSAENGDRVTGIEPEALKSLEDYSWPGNVRQLRNIVERMVVLSDGGKLTLEDVPLEIREKPAPVVKPPEPGEFNLAENEKQRILAALEACKGNQTKASDMLGISRRTLHRKLVEWGMP